MDPSDKGPAKFFKLFKVHKEHESGTTPPERLINSGSGSVTENISLFVDHHINELANQHPSFLQDTPDFLRSLEELNKELIPEDAILVTIDVSGLYTNIEQEEALEAVKEALEENNNPEVPADFILQLLDLVLKFNVFEFNSELFLQIIWTAMGTRAAPSYANLFMARKIDPKIVELATLLANGTNPITFFKRFLDDIFMVYNGSVESLHIFLTELNKLHPTIKFTMSHTVPNLNENGQQCECDHSASVAFLDTSCRIFISKIIVDLYRKKTDRNQYLLTSSCHPAHVTKNIPYSLALRIVRICSLPEDRDRRLNELKCLLLAREYKTKLIDAAIQRAKMIPRSEALQRVITSEKNQRTVFAITFDPRLPSISGIVKKHWRTMVKDPHLAETFPSPPLVAYRRPPNIRDKLVRSKVPPLLTSDLDRHVIYSISNLLCYHFYPMMKCSALDGPKAPHLPAKA